MMKRLTLLRRAAALLCCAVLLCAALPVQAAAKSDLTLTVSVTAYGNRARTLLQKINALRKQNDLPEYVMLADLEKVALQRAAELFIHFDHKRPDLTQYHTADDAYPKVRNCNLAAESIAAGMSSAAEVFEEWSGDDDTLKNLLSDEFTHVGIACVQAPGSYNGTYWCLYLQRHGDSFKATRASASATAGVKKKLTVEIKRGLYQQADDSHRGFLLKADNLNMKSRRTALPTVYLYDKRGAKLGVCELKDLSYESGDKTVCSVLKNGTVNRKGAGKATVTVKAAGIGSTTFTVTCAGKATAASNALGKATLTARACSDHVSLSVYVKGASGYVLYRSGSRDGSYRKVDEQKTTQRWTYQADVSEKPKTYYYKARAYKTVSGERVYGAYSAVVKVKH